VDALQTKLFLLLQTEQYDAALTLIESDADPSRLAYERAYCLYRLQKETEAKDLLEVVKKSKSADDRGVLHLEAQLVRVTRLEVPQSTHFTVELSRRRV
jgi:signal recognition particle subunit SRP72